MTGQYFGWEFPQPNRIAVIQGETPEIGVKSLGTHESVVELLRPNFHPSGKHVSSQHKELLRDKYITNEGR